MNRSLAAAAFAVLTLSALAAPAAAAPYPPTYPYYGYTRLACSTGSYSVERGKDFILVRNLMNRSVAQGTKIQLVISVRKSTHRIRYVRTETMWKTLGGGTDTITFTQPAGAYACSARVISR